MAEEWWHEAPFEAEQPRDEREQQWHGYEAAWENRPWNEWSYDGWWSSRPADWPMWSNHGGSSSWWSDRYSGWSTGDWWSNRPDSGDWSWQSWGNQSEATRTSVEPMADDDLVVRSGVDEVTEGASSRPGGDGRKRITGKEVLPSFDGSTPLREYRRRVELFLATTGIDEEYRAGRLAEKLEGRAWLAIQTLEVSKLRSPEGVTYLLQHLQQELEPIEHLQTFTTLHHFFKVFQREKGEEFVSFDTKFRDQLQKLEEVGAKVDGLVKSFFFLEAANISNDLRKQVVAAAGSDYTYEKLRAALVAIVPTVKRDDHGSSASNSELLGRPVSLAKRAQRVMVCMPLKEKVMVRWTKPATMMRRR